MDLAQAEDDIERICLSEQDESEGEETEGASLLTSVLRVAQMLRHILRLNSTKMLPQLWQTQNLPPVKHSPWIATFVSPLYSEIIEPQIDLGL